MRSRIWMEVPAYVLLALVCAWGSNRLAGPTRRLSWLPEAAAKPVPGSLPRTSLPPPTPPPTPAEPKPPPAVFPTKTAPPAPAPVPDQKTELLSRFPPLVDAAQADITGEEAAWLHGHGALFVDARRTATYTLGHISGAKSLPAWEDGLAGKADQLSLFTADLKLPVVVYCSGGDCHDSHLVAEKLWQAGFRNLRIYAGGYPDWEARKLAVVKGERP